MKTPTAFPIGDAKDELPRPRAPRAFEPGDIVDLPVTVLSLSDPDAAPETIVPALPRRNWLTRLLWSTAGILISLALGLAADNLIHTLFETNPALGWVGLGVLGLFVLALVALVVREAASLWRLRTLDHLKTQAAAALAHDNLRQSKAILRELETIYAPRPDMARAMTKLRADEAQLFDGGE
ncbi:MAG: TIGR01620 family protein, partial [Devosia sp.]